MVYNRKIMEEINLKCPFINTTDKYGNRHTMFLTPWEPCIQSHVFFASEVLDIHKSVLISFGVETSDDELDLPYIYWIPKMHKIYINTDSLPVHPNVPPSLSILLTKLLTHIKQGIQKYYETAYSRSGINQMWILKNSKELLEHLKSPTFNHVTSIK